MSKSKEEMYLGTPVMRTLREAPRDMYWLQGRLDIASTRSNDISASEGRETAA